MAQRSVYLDPETEREVDRIAREERGHFGSVARRLIRKGLRAEGYLTGIMGERREDRS